MIALTFNEFGTSEVLNYIEVPDPVLSKGEILVQNKAIGLNYADIYRRKGNYHLKGEPPFIAGYEGAGVVTASNSEKYNIGDRIAYTDVPFANAEYTKLPESHAIPIPDDIDYNMAASVLLQGLTAHYLINDSHNVAKGETILVHAASGGVGQIITQLCKAKGAKVIGLSRSEDKLQTILDNGADHAVKLDDKWKSKVAEITGNIGVDVAYDSVGSTLKDSFAVTRDCGHVVFYGMSGGDPEPVDPRMLMDTSKTLTGGDLWSYLNSEKERHERANLLFDLIRKGTLKIKDPVIFNLSEGSKAHDYLENGKSTSKVLLIPD
ncbi:quinone oxidoreductase family protein [Christiangramia aquimixticola]|uniref:quinone oxidoreductase family protein n=1 Tax=Christiangramia aquimixticola TaxID=1697558 RepID=UPI003AA82CE0